MKNFILRREDGAVILTGTKGYSDQPCECGNRSQFLCDYPLTDKPGWCDRRLCRQCRHVAAPGKDHCKEHHKLSKGAAS